MVGGSGAAHIEEEEEEEEDILIIVTTINSPSKYLSTLLAFTCVWGDG